MFSKIYSLVLKMSSVSCFYKRICCPRQTTDLHRLQSPWRPALIQNHPAALLHSVWTSWCAHSDPPCSPPHLLSARLAQSVHYLGASAAPRKHSTCRGARTHMQLQGWSVWRCSGVITKAFVYPLEKILIVFAISMILWCSQYAESNCLYIHPLFSAY